MCEGDLLSSHIDDTEQALKFTSWMSLHHTSHNSHPLKVSDFMAQSGRLEDKEAVLLGCGTAINVRMTSCCSILLKAAIQKKPSNPSSSCFSLCALTSFILPRIPVLLSPPDLAFIRFYWSCCNKCNNHRCERNQ